MTKLAEECKFFAIKRLFVAAMALFLPLPCEDLICETQCPALGYRIAVPLWDLHDRHDRHVPCGAEI
jgi:hypothetical protein